MGIDCCFSFALAFSFVKWLSLKFMENMEVSFNLWFNYAYFSVWFFFCFFLFLTSEEGIEIGKIMENKRGPCSVDHSSFTSLASKRQKADLSISTKVFSLLYSPSNIPLVNISSSTFILLLYQRNILYQEWWGTQLGSVWL